MIMIIGDTYEELAVLQSVISTGILNAHDMSEITFDTTYKLSSGNVILTDKYGNIVGEKSTDCRTCKGFEVCSCDKNGHENGTSIGYSIGDCKYFEPQEIHCNCTDEEIAKSFIEDVEEVKDLLPIAESEVTDETDN